MSEYERAMLRLEAFKALAGWGTNDENGCPHPWNMGERRKHAETLAKWAAEPEVTTEEEP